MIVIVANGSDLGADLVIRHLAERGEAYIRVDFSRLGRPQFHFGFGLDGPELIYGALKVKARDVRAVWARRFARPSILDHTDPRFVDFTLRELACTSDAFFESVPGVQVNSFDADRKAGNRLLQCERAKSLGFKVPETLVTQAIARARSFVSDNGPVVTKALSYGELDAAQGVVAYTNRVGTNTDFAGVESCPVLLQRDVPKAFEWRITTVGERVFSARTRQNHFVDAVDWRRTERVEDIFEQAILPLQIERRILHLCDLSGIHYGAHDLIETPDGEFFFLETNPAGQWGWLELSLGLPIGEALASLLMDPGSARQ